MTTYPTRTRRWTRAEDGHLIEIGFFHTEDRIELIGGELMVAEPQSAGHYTAICKSPSAGATLAAKSSSLPAVSLRCQLPLARSPPSICLPDVLTLPLYSRWPALREATLHRIQRLVKLTVK